MVLIELHSFEVAKEWELTKRLSLLRMLGREIPLMTLETAATSEFDNEIGELSPRLDVMRSNSDAKA